MNQEELLEEYQEEESFFSFSFPCIFEAPWQESIPAGFNTVTIHLDGRIQANLDWKKEREQAQEAVEKGCALMWNLDLGLVDALSLPLANQSQFLSLTLALEHFRDSLWKEFKAQTLGISIFKGSADFSYGFPWDEHQEENFKIWLEERNGPSSELASLRSLYCRDVVVEYLSLLATRLPDTLPTYLYLDASELHSFLKEMQFLNPERFDRLHLVLKGQQLPFEALGWKKPTPQGYSGSLSVDLPTSSAISVALCVPPMHFYHSHHYEGLEEGIRILKERNIPFKLIAESHLTSQWDGLDYLLYTSAGLSSQGKRKLQGFCAAGGTVISTTGQLLGFPYELNLNEWLGSYC